MLLDMFYFFLQVKLTPNWGENNLLEISQIQDFMKCCRVNVPPPQVVSAGSDFIESQF
jgi:hypothetical protein